MQSFSQIVCTPDTLCGSPRIHGRRIAVGDVVGNLASCNNLEEVVFDFELTYEQIFQALNYCSALQCKKDNPVVFCHNCSLRRDQEGPIDISTLEEFTIHESSYVKSGNSIYLGTLNDFLGDWNGREMWPIAAELLLKFGETLHAEK